MERGDVGVLAALLDFTLPRPNTKSIRVSFWLTGLDKKAFWQQVDPAAARFGFHASG